MSGSGGAGRAWRLAVGCKGALRLGRARGSVAIVEAVVCPVVAGVLPPPSLVLRGLRDGRDEDEDDGGQPNSIVVTN